MPKLGYVDFPFGQPSFPDPGITRLAVDNAGNPIASIGGAAFAAIGGGGGAVADGVTITGAGTVASPLVATAQFGADTKIQQLNSASALKTTWEGIAAYTTNTAGSEVSNYTIKTLVAGAQATSQVITGTGTLFPAGTNAVPGVQVGDTGTGMVKGTSGGDFVGWVLDGTLVAYSRPSTFIVPNSFLRIGGEASGLISMGISADSTTQNLVLSSTFSGSTSDVVVGLSNALATNATAGFLQVPVMAGAPTGSAHLNTGKMALVGDSTNSKIWVSFVAGTWKGVAVA